MLFCSVASAITSESVAKMLISSSIERLEPIKQSLGRRSGVANRHARSQIIQSEIVHDEAILFSEEFRHD